MLCVCRRGEVGEARALAPEEDRALREAFGRFAVPAARAAGTAVVQRYQHAGAGHWFACSCLGPGVRPPVLVPVAEAHIRRHQDPPWPAHAEACDFYRDPDEQRRVGTIRICGVPDAGRRRPLPGRAASAVALSGQTTALFSRPSRAPHRS